MINSRKMYQTYRRAPRKRTADYFMPFLIILILIGIIFASWNFLSKLLVDSSRNTLDQKVSLSIEGGSAKAMATGDQEWKNVPDDISLYAGEKIKTGADGRATLTYPDESFIRLDHSTEMEFLKLKKKNEANMSESHMTAGRLWAEIEPILDPDSYFSVSTDLLEVRSAEGIFAMEAPGTIYMVKGSAQVNIKQGKSIVKTVRLGIGQQLMVDSILVGNLKEGSDQDLIFALDDLFKSSTWYRWNMEQDGVLLPAIEEADEDSEDGIEDDDVEGESSDEDEDDELTEDDEDVEDVMTDDEKEELANDKTPPAAPKVTSPIVSPSKGFAEVDDVVVTIEGTADADTTAIVVNDYQLSKFKQGDKTFQYTANVAFDNLKVGENEYEIYAKDKAGNKSEITKVILFLSQEVYDDKKKVEEEADEADKSADELPAAKSTGGVSITAPNGGESLSTSETSFEIKGNVPEGTAKVLVNDYQLGAFSKGDSSFLYRASSTLGNLTIGQKNTYTAEAYDEDGDLIGSASITIDVESGSASAPVVTIPTSDATYSTNLNEIVLGGTVGKWATRVFINGQNLNEYIPGSEEWKTSVTLEPGDTTFTVHAEKEGVKTGEDKITITYQP